MSLYACPYCGKEKPSRNGTGSDVACCGEIGHSLTADSVIEECAKVCENQGRMSASLDPQTFYIALGQAARAIRALKRPSAKAGTPDRSVGMEGTSEKLTAFESQRFSPAVSTDDEFIQCSHCKDVGLCSHAGECVRVLGK